MKNSSEQEDPFFHGNSPESDPQPDTTPHLTDNALEGMTGAESDPIEASSQEPNPARSKPLSRYRKSVKMLRENWETAGTIKATTRAVNMEIFAIVKRRAISDLADGNPDVESSITAPQIIEHFINSAMNGQYSKPACTRYRTAIMSELHIQLKMLGDPQEMSEYVDAIDILSRGENSPRAIFYANQGITVKGGNRQASEKQIGRADLKTIIRELEARGNHGIDTLLWVKATIATGLRPVEWDQSELDDEGVLHTRRAKSHRHIAAFDRMKMAQKIAGRELRTVHEADAIIIESMGQMPVAHIIEHRKLELDGEDLEGVKGRRQPDFVKIR